MSEIRPIDDTSGCLVMNQRHTKPLTFREIMINGIQLGKKTFMAIFPFTVVMATLMYVLQPRSIPTFQDAMDWVVFVLFLMGVFFISACHASVVFRMDSFVQNKPTSLESSIWFGIKNSIWIFTITLIYSCIVLLGLSLLVVPGIYLAVLFYFSLFYAVLDKPAKKTSNYKKIQRPFKESVMLVNQNWWRVLAMLVVISLAFLAIDILFLWILEFQVVVPLLFGVLIHAALLVFWYGCVFSMMSELKYRNHLWRKKVM